MFNDDMVKMPGIVDDDGEGLIWRLYVCKGPRLSDRAKVMMIALIVTRQVIATTRLVFTEGGRAAGASTPVNSVWHCMLVVVMRDRHVSLLGSVGHRVR